MWKRRVKSMKRERKMEIKRKRKNDISIVPRKTKDREEKS
jgi:hypothetical protein